MIRRLGDWAYRSEDRLGGGGYAQVYRGRSATAGEAAVKVFDDPIYANTLEHEVAALQTMAGCPGTPGLIDYGRNAAGALCIVTTLVPGRRLDKHGPLTDAQARALVQHMLAVLAYAHGRGLLHKDIKASNILVDGDRYVLLDWGVAEPIGDGRAETIRAKQDYVAPECYYGRHGVATDFYSLGWLIVQATTGALPYHFAANRERDYRVAAHCLERPELPDTLPGSWRPLVENWIAKDAQQRQCGYDLDALMARVQFAQDVEGLDHRNIGRNTGCLRQAADAGVPYAQHELAVRLLKEGRRDEARFWLEKAAAAGYARSACRLAAALAADGSDDVDAARAKDLLLAAAHAGNGDAAYRLGLRLFADGDAAAAAVWMKHAADDGHRDAQYRYARWLDAGTAQDGVAARYYAAAAERGHARARARLEAS